jgi:AraC-like DNA-binding protein/mannose-6-phosphate isomerase-like protein (cupin superfamily)
VIPPSKTSLPAPAWKYWCPEQARGVEFGTLRSDHAAGLKTHFHNESQITFVISGVRSFLVREEQINLTAGQYIVFPAGLPHKALPVQTAGTVCVNTYLPASGDAVTLLAACLERLWDRGARLQLDDVPEMFLTNWPQNQQSVSPDAFPSSTSQNVLVRLRALRANLSREGFSRRFSQDYGMPPHAFDLVSRLNAARGLLRAGADDLAAIAAETGFADQSHMGRLFHRTFGTTPGRYRRH